MSGAARVRRYVCIDFEMSDLSAHMRRTVHGISSEIIQIGAVMLDERYNLLGSFDLFVHPQYSQITPIIQRLTGITAADIADAKPFIPAMEQYLAWRERCAGGPGAEVLTFSWSRSDYTQLSQELAVKAAGRADLRCALDNFVDLQKTFGALLGAGKAVSLDAAAQFSHVTFTGKHHSAVADAYNTACILHKICCAKALCPQFDFLGAKAGKRPRTAAAPRRPGARRRRNRFALFRLLSRIRLPDNSALAKKMPGTKYGIPFMRLAQFSVQTFFASSLRSV